MHAESIFSSDLDALKQKISELGYKTLGYCEFKNGPHMNLSAWLLRLRQLGPLGVLTVIAWTLPPLGSLVIFAYADSISHRLRDDPSTGVFIYITAFALTCGLALMPTYAASALAGYVFGFSIGLCAVMTAIALGVLLAYVIGRAAGQQRLVTMLNENEKARIIYQSLLNSSTLKTAWIVLLIRLPPNSPFAMSNFLLSGAKVKLFPYMLGTTLGMAPRTAAVCWLGATLSSSTFELKNDPLIFAMGVGVTLIVLVALGALARRELRRATRQDQPQHAAADMRDTAAG
jgi:uncharacterized membrane protein YdjX (TVP38/TMEM64 family)